MSSRSPRWPRGKMVECETVSGKSFRTNWRPPPRPGPDRGALRAEAERATAEFLALGGTIKRPADSAPLPPGADPPWEKN